MRSTVSSSSGGKAFRNTPTGPTCTNIATNSTRTTSGAIPFAQVGTATRRAARSVVVSGPPSDIGAPDVKHANPAQLREFALMRVEQIGPGIFVSELQNRPLALAQCYQIGPLEPVEVRAGAVQPVEVAVQVKGVDRVELGDVDQVDPS